MGTFEPKSYVNMNWIAFLCLICTYKSIHGNPSQENHATATFVDTSSDLIAESTNNVAKTKTKSDDDKKTLAQQVAEGRYGLIPTEIFNTPITRPGIISYETNSEVPKDTIKNLGGLNESDIWLAENHLLVIKGGVLSLIDNAQEDFNPVWPPIDDYIAPKRPVKIPKNPKVPPPFPVQFKDGGPIQILGTNFTRTLNESFYPPPYSVSPLEGFDPGSGPFFPPPYQYPSNVTSGKDPYPNSPFFTPIQGSNLSQNDATPNFPPFPIDGLPPFFESLPPGSAVLPPPNITEPYDEDDLSIYYPPPYSFHYDADNSSKVPPGPLVPGIVLPPPPDFFSIQQKTLPSVKPLYKKPTIKTTTQKIEVNTVQNTTTIPTPVYHKPTTTTPFFKPQQKPYRNKTVSVTVLRPVKTSPSTTTTTTPSPLSINPNKLNVPFEVYGPPPPRKKIAITTTKVPLKAYFTTSGETDSNFVTILRKNPYTTRTSLRKKKPERPPQFYYYDDSPATNLVTPYPSEQKLQFRNLSQEYFIAPDERGRTIGSNTQSRYYLPTKQYETQPFNSYNPLPQTQSSNFKAHIVQLQDQIQSYQNPRTRLTQTLPRSKQQQVQTPRPVYQYSFEVSNYKEQHERLHPTYHEQSQVNIPKYAIQIEPAVELTTERPVYQNQPIPIYIQSFSENTQPSASIPRYNYQTQNIQKNVSPVKTRENLNSYRVTPTPIYDSFYTKQDEHALDDITKTHFTTFGKRIHPSTTPLPQSSKTNYDQVYIPQQPKRPGIDPSILVNYINQRPVQNDRNVYVNAPTQREYSQIITKEVPQFIGTYQSPVYEESHKNYRQKVPHNANIETIRAINIPVRATVKEGQAGSFISYELPGDDGAHFYFLTPQLSNYQQNLYDRRIRQQRTAASA